MMSKPLRFLPEQCEDVKQGCKTMTRRPLTWPDRFPQRPPSSVNTWARGRKWALNWTSKEPDWHYGVYDTVCPYGAVGDTVPLLQPNDHEFAKGRITSLGVERVQEITVADAVREGYDDSLIECKRCKPSHWEIDPTGWFMALWDSIYADEGLGVAEKPWVWVIGFEVTKCDH